MSPALLIGGVIGLIYIGWIARETLTRMEKNDD